MGAEDFEVLTWPSQRTVPGLDGVDLDGKPWSLVALRGRAVLLNFWATWCEPCVAELPALQALAAAQPQLQILLLNHAEPESRVRSFVQRQGLALPVLLDVAGRRAPAWGVRIFPSSVLLDAQGQARWLIRGAPDWTAAAMQSLLQPRLPR
jgi:thiol-disulfide isomerase/thioredoxin